MAEGGPRPESFNPNLFTVTLEREMSPGVPVTVVGQPIDAPAPLSPEVLAADPTAFSIERYIFRSEHTSDLVNAYMADTQSQIGSAIAAAHAEGRPVYLTGMYIPAGLWEVDPTTLTAIAKLPYALGGATLALMGMHVATDTQRKTRRDLLKAGFLGTGLATVAAKVGFGERPAVPEIEEVAERLAQYSPHQQEAMLHWYRTLTAFTNLVHARKLHEIARLHGEQPGAAILDVVGADNYGLKAALLMPARERNELIERFMRDVAVPLAEHGVISSNELGVMLASTVFLDQFTSAQDSETPYWIQEHLEIPGTLIPAVAQEALGR